MKLRGRQCQLDARERAFQHHVEQARIAAARLRTVAGEVSPALVVGAGVVTGVLAAQLPRRTWTAPLAGTLLFARQVARVPVGRWLLVALTKRKRHWMAKLRAAGVLAKRRPPGAG